MKKVGRAIMWDRGLLPYVDDPEQRDYTAAEIQDAIRERASQQLLKKRAKKK